jgi:hypothetical protein
MVTLPFVQEGDVEDDRHQQLRRTKPAKGYVGRGCEAWTAGVVSDLGARRSLRSWSKSANLAPAQRFRDVDDRDKPGHDEAAIFVMKFR